MKGFTPGLNGGESPSKEWPLEDFARAYAPALFDEIPLATFDPYPASQLPAYTEAEVNEALEALEG